MFLLRLFSRVSTPVRRGDVVHLEGRPDAGSWLVDREQGFLVLLPDSLVSGTSISSSIRCMRRAVLGDMFKVHILLKCPTFLLFGPPLNILQSHYSLHYQRLEFFASLFQISFFFFM